MRFPASDRSNLSNHTSLTLNKLALSVILGWPDNERKNAQTVYLDIHIVFTKIPKACESGHLDDTICYNTLVLNLKAFLEKKAFHLLEELGNTIYQWLIINIQLPVVISIRLTKFPDVPGLEGGVSFQLGDQTASW